MQQVGFKGSLQDFFEHMRTDKQFEFKSEDALLAYYRGLEAKVMKGVPSQFSLLPRPASRSARSRRSAPSPRPAANTRAERGRLAPRHLLRQHLRPARAQDLGRGGPVPARGDPRPPLPGSRCSKDRWLTGVPAFRRFGGNTAYIEGWGLYAESLGKDLGVYETPHDYFGYLQNEACGARSAWSPTPACTAKAGPASR